MKDILYEEHRKALIEGSHFVNGQVSGLLIQGAIDRSVELTRKHMKGLITWIGDNNYDETVAGWVDLTIDCEPEDAVWYTIEQLIDKYFESLNK